MNTILVWVLVTATAAGSNQVFTYSPLMADLESCEFLQKQVFSMGTNYTKSKCVQIKIVKGEK